MGLPTVSFRAIRLTCTALLFAGAVATLVLAILTAARAGPRAGPVQWIAPLFPAFSALCTLGVLLWRPLLPGRPQLVVVELLWPPCIAFFHATTFFSACMLADTSKTARIAPGLRICSTTVAILACAYWLFIAALALLTRLALDPDIWTRDVGASPPPFPAAHLRAALAARIRASPRVRSASAPALCTSASCTEAACGAEKPPALRTSPLPGALEVYGGRFDIVDARVPQIRIPTAADQDRAVKVGLKLAPA